MSSLAKVRKRLPCDIGVLFGDRFDRHSRTTDKGIELAVPTVFCLCLDNGSGLDESRCRQTADIRISDGFSINPGVLLIEQDRDDCGRIDDRRGRLLSS
jgi:hypothetical protein